MTMAWAYVQGRLRRSSLLGLLCECVVGDEEIKSHARSQEQPRWAQAVREENSRSARSARRPHRESMRLARPDRAFAYVTATPPKETPAGKGGLILGDAILSLGGARHLRDLQPVLASSVGSSVRGRGG